MFFILLLADLVFVHVTGTTLKLCRNIVIFTNIVLEPYSIKYNLYNGINIITCIIVPRYCNNSISAGTSTSYSFSTLVSVLVLVSLRYTTFTLVVE